MNAKFLFLLASLVFLCGSIAGNAYTGPDDVGTVTESEKAVKLLGPGRGAVMIIHGMPLDIVGINSLSCMGTSTGIDQTLRSLGAKKIGTDVLISLSGDILFDFDKWNIKKGAEDMLNKLAGAITELNKQHILIEGHTDSKGAESYNIKLSYNRAAAVKDWFILNHDMAGKQFKVKAYGEAKPVALNTKPDGSDNPEGRAKNRRVEMRLSD